MTEQPTKLHLHTDTQVLKVHFGAKVFEFPAEFLRVHSTSAEVKGHGAGQETLVTGKQAVMIKNILPVGQYGVSIHFDDGHDSGIYTWDYLKELGQKKSQFWQTYLDKLEQSGKARDPHTTAVKMALS